VLADLQIDLVNKEEHKNERQRFFYKMGAGDQKYIEISVNGNPLDKTHVDTELDINVGQSVIVFTPVFVTRL
jgi:hypothetical protein